MKRKERAVVEVRKLLEQAGYAADSFGLPRFTALRPMMDVRLEDGTVLEGVVPLGLYLALASASDPDDATCPRCGREMVQEDWNHPDVCPDCGRALELEGLTWCAICQEETGLEECTCNCA